MSSDSDSEVINPEKADWEKEKTNKKEDNWVTFNTASYWNNCLIELQFYKRFLCLYPDNPIPLLLSLLLFITPLHQKRIDIDLVRLKWSHPIEGENQYFSSSS